MGTRRHIPAKRSPEPHRCENLTRFAKRELFYDFTIFTRDIFGLFRFTKWRMCKMLQLFLVTPRTDRRNPAEAYAKIFFLF
jgi:hypothetical protein